MRTRGLRSDMGGSRGSAVDDGVGVAANLEKRRDAAHRLAVAKADEAARMQALKQVLRGDAAREVIEIDQHVATENDVEQPLRRGILAPDDVHRREANGFAQFGNDPPPLLRQSL